MAETSRPTLSSAASRLEALEKRLTELSVRANELADRVGGPNPPTISESRGPSGISGAKNAGGGLVGEFETALDVVESLCSAISGALSRLHAAI